MTIEPQQQRPPATDTHLHCPYCGYNLTGLTENSCPECGAGFDRDELKPFGSFERIGKSFLWLFAPPVLVAVIGFIAGIIAVADHEDAGLVLFYMDILIILPVSVLTSSIYVARKMARRFVKRPIKSGVSEGSIAVTIGLSIAFIALEAFICLWATFGGCMAGIGLTQGL